MKAVRFHEYGGIEVLRYEDVDRPRPAPGEVLVQVAGAAFNPIDTWFRAGIIDQIYPVTFPHTLGLDLAGTVVEQGDGVGLPAVGDAVIGFLPMTGPGAAAEFVGGPCRRPGGSTRQRRARRRRGDPRRRADGVASTVRARRTHVGTAGPRQRRRRRRGRLRGPTGEAGRSHRHRHRQRPQRDDGPFLRRRRGHRLHHDDDRGCGEGSRRPRSQPRRRLPRGHRCAARRHQAGRHPRLGDFARR